MRKWNTETVKEFIFTTSGGELLDEYKNNSTKINIKCKCGNVFNISFANYKDKNIRKCKECSGSILTYENVEQLAINYECVLLTDKESFNTKDKLSFKCNCGDVFYKTYNAFKSTPQCRKCSFDKYKLDFEYVKEYVSSYGNGTTLLSTEYKSIHEKLNFMCSCGNHFSTSFNEFKNANKTTCNDCGRKRAADYFRFSTEYVKQYLLENNYTCKLTGEYNGYYESIDLQCECGNMFATTFSSLRKTHGVCSDCRKKYISEIQLNSQEQYENSVYNIWGNEYSIIGEYRGSGKQVLIKHNKCGNTYKSKASRLLEEVGCPRCNESKGEKRIQKYLKAQNIIFVPQYKFDDCKDIGKLPFDCAIFTDNYDLICCIEYDGEDHYKHIKRSKNDTYNTINKRYIDRKRKDKIKTDYCLKNNIELIRIPYWDFNNIEDILNKKLLCNCEKSVAFSV